MGNIHSDASIQRLVKLWVASVVLKSTFCVWRFLVVRVNLLLVQLFIALCMNLVNFFFQVERRSTLLCVGVLGLLVDAHRVELAVRLVVFNV